MNTIKTPNKDIFDVTVHDFDEKVIKASQQRPVLVDFWADWCSPCIVVAPILAQVIEEFTGQIALAKLEVDEGDNMKVAGRYQTRGFPTVILIRNGEEIERFTGAKPRHFIREFVAKHL